MILRPQTLRLTLLAPAAIVLVVFLLVPYLNIVVMSVRPSVVGAPYGDGFTLANYGRFFADPYYVAQLANTFAIAAASTALPAGLASLRASSAARS